MFSHYIIYAQPFIDQISLFSWSVTELTIYLCGCDDKSVGVHARSLRLLCSVYDTRISPTIVIYNVMCNLAPSVCIFSSEQSH